MQFKFYMKDLLSLIILLWPGQVLTSGSYVFSYHIFSFQTLEWELIWLWNLSLKILL